jgi:hypothetical protein
VYAFAYQHEIKQLLPLAGLCAMPGIRLEDVVEWDVPKPILRILLRSWDRLERLLTMHTLRWLQADWYWSFLGCQSGEQCDGVRSRLRLRFVLHQNPFDPRFIFKSLDGLMQDLPNDVPGPSATLCTSCRAVVLLVLARDQDTAWQALPAIFE